VPEFDGGACGGGVEDELVVVDPPPADVLVAVLPDEELPVEADCGRLADVADAAFCTAPQPLRTNDAITASAKEREACFIMKSPRLCRTEVAIVLAETQSYCSAVAYNISATA
jgi:hypothetical protein